MLNDISLVLTIGLIVLLLIVFLFALISTPKVSNAAKDEIYKQIDEIKYTMSMHNPAGNRDGIVRLDALLSKSLQLRHSNKLACGENLKKSKRLMSPKLYEDIWYYHKLRNNIVHENIEINDNDAINAYKTYVSVITKLLNK